ncbi:MAG TPA: DNA ligase D [Gemmataceae bacterium]|nr:DNA ligase D [Gemmataceae bacterium]
MSLSEYNRKRHFGTTPEPAGKEAPSGGRSFVVQKHAASHLHYDFRLELDGVLKSWAVPKGPSLDPSVKRLAMNVEDHPVEYGGFEGIIPEGEYGGGTVMLWDRGTWEPVGDAAEGYRTGKLKFMLHGEKLHGGWMLVRTHFGKDKEGRQWLLFKERDRFAKSGKKADITDTATESVATGRGLEEIAADKDRVWDSTGEVKQKKKTAPKTAPKKKSKAKKAGPTSKLPRRIDVELATLVKEPPEGDDWFHEIKFDGYRMIARLDHGHVEFVTRNHKDWTNRLKALAAAAAELPAETAILDGEVVALRDDGTTDFQELQNAFREGAADRLIYYVFDLLHLDGHDPTREPLETRKRKLAELLDGAPKNIRFSEHVEGNGAQFFAHGCKMHLEGILSKRRDAPYRPGRGGDWLKSKCVQNDEFVIGGYTDPERSREGIGALLVGFHKRGKLHYVGKVGTGFDDRTLRKLEADLSALEVEDSPFTDLTRRAAKVHWVEPKLVAQVAFGTWTRDDRLRHASFQGLREDKPATEVTRDKPVAASAAAHRTKDASRLAAMRSGVRKSRSPRKATATRNVSEAQDGYDAQTQQFHGVRVTSPDKVLYPEQGITKLDLARYYEEVADWILPQLADRPIVLVRCPDGREKECFYQKHPGVGTPTNLRTIPIREKSKTEKYLLVDDAAGLISLAQIGALEIHAWGCRSDKLESPDRLIFDLDPDPSVQWPAVVAAARQVRKFLQDLGLESFLKTTGGKGLHLVVPIERRHDWDAAKAFCKDVADAVVAADPDRYTANMSKAARPGKIFLDYLRNGRGATAVVAYSTRSRLGAPVSMPLTWTELGGDIRSDTFNVGNVPARLAKLKRDPWEGLAKLRQSLTGPIAALKKLR